MRAESRRIADAFWAGDLGCEEAALRPAAPRVQAHVGARADYHGAFILVLDGAPVVSVPARLLHAVAPRAAEFRAEVVADPARLHPLLPGSDPARMIGPAHVCYADRSCLVPAPAPSARPLSPGDEAAFHALRDACAPDDWNAKEFALEPGRIHGAFGASGELLAIAHFRLWGERIAHLGVVTRPDVRRRGHGAAVVSSLSLDALRGGYLPQYRVLASNAPSVRVAEKLGFQPYGWSMAARFGAA